LAHLQVKPANILDSCMMYLRERRIEITSYTIMRSIIHTALSEYESDLEQTLERHIPVGPMRHHINLHGEFDFRELQTTPTFDMEAILNLFVG